jgi:hypothetical protein
MKRDHVAHKGEKLAGLEADLCACFRPKKELSFICIVPVP